MVFTRASLLGVPFAEFQSFKNLQGNFLLLIIAKHFLNGSHRFCISHGCHGRVQTCMTALAAYFIRFISKKFY